jgi:transcriptional regulator with GAF, ATPase, and Fis domain
MVYDSFSWFSTILASPLLLAAIKTIAIIVKIAILVAFLRLKQTTQFWPKLYFLVVVILSCSIFQEAFWIIKLLQCDFIILSRIGWILSIIEYLSLSFFIDYLVNPRSEDISWRQYIFAFTALSLCCFQIFIIISHLGHPHDKTTFELAFYKFLYFYILGLLIPCLYSSLRVINSNTLPKILTAQIKTFIKWFIIPHLVIEFLGVSPSIFFSQLSINAFISISTILLTYALYFLVKKMVNIRFLNIRPHVETTYNTDFINDFKDILEQLAYVTNNNQIKQIINSFFKKALKIPAGKAVFYLRAIDTHSLLFSDFENLDKERRTMLCVENMLSHFAQSEAFKAMLQQNKIIIRDEIEFTHFYAPNDLQQAIIAFLQEIKADIFLPIYEKNNIIGYIIVEHNVRPNQLFGNVDRDEMVIFATYLGNIINLLHHGNIQSLIHEQKELKEELYQKHQEINQYKESIRSFLRTTRERKIGIIFYKNRKFSYGNQAAQDLIKIDMNNEHGHPLAQELKKIVRQALEYKSTQTIITHDEQGNKLVMNAIMSFENNSVIIMTYYPEIADMLHKSLDLLKDPSDWDYVLYLETTKSGQLINQLIPGTSETALHFKIDILKAALSRKAVLLDIPQEDVTSTVELIHHISLRSELHMLKLTSPEKNYEVALKLFGINPLFGMDKSADQAILEKLNNVGTLFIENIDLLNLETQNYLAEFITYGYFKPLRSDRKINSDVRIICSTQKNLSVLVKEGYFSQNLLNVLTSTTVKLPSLMHWEPSELKKLMEGYLEQKLQSNELKNLLELNEKEQQKILEQKPLSLQELKEYTHNALTQKSTKKKIHEITISPVITTSDPELQQAIRLGKRALKDVRIMTMLWNKFKNQNKIAELLGVNRSSVNRRCKEYNLF